VSFASFEVAFVQRYHDPQRAGDDKVTNLYGTGMTWDFIDRLRAIVKGKLVLKGIMGRRGSRARDPGQRVHHHHAAGGYAEHQPDHAGQGHSRIAVPATGNSNGHGNNRGSNGSCASTNRRDATRA
jgi:hypothetical protein